MENCEHHGKAAQLLDELLGSGTFKQASAAIDQAPVQFFVEVLARELSRTHKDSVVILGKDRLFRTLFRDYHGNLYLVLEVKFLNFQDPSQKGFVNPFELNLKVEYSVLHEGVQLKKLCLGGGCTNWARMLLMGKAEAQILLDRVKKSLSKGDHPLTVLVSLSPGVGIGLLEAVTMGANIEEIESLTKMSVQEIQKFLEYLQTFVNGGSFSRYLEFGSASHIERRNLRTKVGLILQKIKNTMKKISGSVSPLEDPGLKGSFEIKKSRGLRMPSGQLRRRHREFDSMEKSKAPVLRRVCSTPLAPRGPLI